MNQIVSSLKTFDYIYTIIINTKIYKYENPTIELIIMLVRKHNLDFDKTLSYIKVEAPKSINMKMFFSGFMFELSVNKGKIKRNCVNKLREMQ